MALQGLARQELRRDLPATLEAVEEFFGEVRVWMLAHQVPGHFALELLIREALTNAVVHGCQCDPSKHVACILRARAGRVTIAVRDQGAGFDWRSARPGLPAPGACCGRGLAIFREYADRVRFNRRGNSLVLIDRFSGEASNRPAGPAQVSTGQVTPDKEPND